jgi:hypothetical protein
VCTDNRSSNACRTDAVHSCDWGTMLNQCVEPGCVAADPTACGLLPNCTWVTTGTPACLPKCWAFTTSTTCSAAGCGWVGYRNKCFAPCLATSNQNATSCAGLTATFGCAWQPDGCLPTLDCNTLSGNDSACDASPYCWVNVESVCEPKSCDPGVGTCIGTCVDKLATGQSCYDTSSCASGIAINPPAGQELPVCVEPVAETRGCTFGLTQLTLSTAFAFGGVFFLRRRRRT